MRLRRVLTILAAAGLVGLVAAGPAVASGGPGGVGGGAGGAGGGAGGGTAPPPTPVLQVSPGSLPVTSGAHVWQVTS